MINNLEISNVYHCNTTEFTINIELIPTLELEVNNDKIYQSTSNVSIHNEINLSSFHKNNFKYLTNICNRILLNNNGNNGNNNNWFGARSILISSPQGSGKSFLLDSMNTYVNQFNIKLKQDNSNSSIHIINLIGSDINSNNSNSSSDSSSSSSSSKENGLNKNKIDINNIDNDSLIDDNINILLNSLEKKKNSTKIDINNINKNDSILILIDDLDRVLMAYNIDDNDTCDNFKSIATCLNHLLKLISYSNKNNNNNNTREIIIIGTTRIQEKFLLRANTGAPEFEKILKIPRLSETERSEIICDLLLIIDEFELELIDNNFDINNNNDNNNDNINNNNQYKNISLWSQRLSKLSNGYLPGDLTNVVKRLIGIQRGCNKPLSSIKQSITTNDSADSTNKTSSINNDNNKVSLSKPILLYSNALIAISNVPPKQLQNLNLISSVGNNDIGLKSSRSLSWYDFAGYSDIKNKIIRLLQRQCSNNTNINDNNNLDNNKKKNILFQTNMIPRGIVLHGPSGCGKSYLAKIISNEAKMNFVSVRSTELLSKYFGETEGLIRNLFQQARSASPCVLFFDEFDAIACKRDSSCDNSLYTRILSTFLNEMDGITSSSDIDADSGGVLVLAACTDVNILDEALLRPGRLQHHIELNRPQLQDIIDIFNLQLNKMPHDNDINSIEICSILMSSNPTASDVNSLCKNALLIAIEESINSSNYSNNCSTIVRNVSSNHFIKALDNKGLLNQEKEEEFHQKYSKPLHVFDTPFVFTPSKFSIGNRL
jgi:SpoVK/Ycf46/Vps4 family AAA+-type ATPase